MLLTILTYANFLKFLYVKDNLLTYFYGYPNTGDEWFSVVFRRTDVPFCHIWHLHRPLQCMALQFGQRIDKEGENQCRTK